MGMRSLDLGLNKQSLVATTGGRELLYHLRLVPKGNHKDVVSLKINNVQDTDSCKVYRGNQLVAITSTQELEKLIRLSSFKTMELVEVKTEDNSYFAAVNGDLLKREYVGVLTDENCRACAFVLEVSGTYWANTGSRLIQLEFSTEEPLVTLKAQMGIRYLNSNPQLLDSKPDEVILFK